MCSAVVGFAVFIGNSSQEMENVKDYYPDADFGRLMEFEIEERP